MQFFGASAHTRSLPQKLHILCILFSTTKNHFHQFNKNDERFRGSNEKKMYTFRCKTKRAIGRRFAHWTLSLEAGDSESHRAHDSSEIMQTHESRSFRFFITQINSAKWYRQRVSHGNTTKRERASTRWRLDAWAGEKERSNRIKFQTQVSPPSSFFCFSKQKNKLLMTEPTKK